MRPMIPTVLRIPELVYLICSFLTPYSRACLARTCKGLLEPALNALWETQSTYNLLTYTLYSCIVHTPLPSGKNTVMTCNPTPRSSDWRRVYSYGRRIRRLIIGRRDGEEDSAVGICPTVIAAWTLCAHKHKLKNSKVLCAHTSRVDWIVLDKEQLRFEHSLWIRPGLPVLRLHMRSVENWHPRPEFASALTTLGSKSLVELRVDASLTFRTVEDAITQLLRHSPALEVVELRHMISPDRILALAALRSLRELRIMRLPVFDEELPKPAFPALRSLYFNWTRHAALMSFLHKISDAFPNLDSLTLGFRPSDALNGLGELTAVCEFVAEHCSPVGLTHLSIADETGGSLSTTSDEVPYYAAKYEHIHGLRSLRGLKTLHIEVWGHVDVDDNDIESLVSSWPALESLRLDKPTESVYEFDTDVKGAHPFVPRATTKSLLSVARHCPNLRELAIAFSAAALTSSDSRGRPGGGLVQHALRKLDTLHTIIQPDEALPLALFLSDVLLALDEVDSDTKLQAEVAKEEGEGIPEGYDGYKKLLELLPIVSKVRRQERLDMKAPRI